jgi:hypothetical protein
MAVEGSGSLLALFIRPGRIFTMAMTRPKFAIGQLVDFDNRNTSTRKPTGPYEVVRVLPMEDGSWRSYRIKSVAEPFERIAKEYEIAAIDRENAAETA